MPLPSRIGKYSIQEVLGRGAVGVVYKGRQEDLGRDVAVKVLIAGRHGSPEMIKRFLREARAAASLSHPGIVQVFDVGQENDLHYIVMEFVEGKSLADLLKSRRLKPEEALAIALRLADALQAAHAKGIIHRDIKPSNILLGSKGRPKIVDFGLATALEEQERLTATGDILGTAWYMSPEQAFGSPDEIDARADLYSLGAVLYEMLTGRPPFDGARATAVLKRIETEEAAPPSRVNSSIDPRLDGLVLKALEKDPARRYGTAEEFAKAIRRAIEETRAPASAWAPLRRAWKPLATLVLIAIVSVLLYRAVPAPQPPVARPVALVRELLERPQGKRALLAAAEALAAAPRTGEDDFWLSKALLELGAVRRALEAATAAIDKGYVTSASRAHRVYLTFLRYKLFHGSARLSILHPHSTMGLEQEIDALRALPTSAEEMRLAEVALLGMKGRHQEAVDRTTPQDRGPLATLRWTALVHRAWEAPDGLKAAREEMAHESAAFFRALLTDTEAEARGLPGALFDDVSMRFAEPFLLRAILMDRQNRPDLALENLDLARRVDPKDALASAYRHALLLAVTEEARKDPAAFAREARPSAVQNLPFPAPYLLDAVADLIEGRPEAAEATLQRTRLRFGSPDSWGENQDWGKLEGLVDLVTHAGEKGPRFLLESARLLSYFRRPSAEAALRKVESQIAASDAGQRFSLKGDRLREMRAEVYLELAALCAAQAQLDGVVENLRKCFQSGGDFEDVLEDSRFDRYRDHARVKELRTKRD